MAFHSDMASRRLLSSLLRSSISRSPLRSQELTRSNVRFSSSYVSPEISPVNTGIFAQTEGFTRFEHSNGLASSLPTNSSQISGNVVFPVKLVSQSEEMALLA